MDDTQHPETPHPDESTDPQSPLGGAESTESELDADNDVEEDMLKTLDPDAPPA